jgi:hypothetical protein
LVPLPLCTWVPPSLDPALGCGPPAVVATLSSRPSPTMPPQGPGVVVASTQPRLRPTGILTYPPAAIGTGFTGLFCFRDADAEGPDGVVRGDPRSVDPGGLTRPAPPQPLERGAPALVEWLERARGVAAEQAPGPVDRVGLDPSCRARRGGVHSFQPGRAVHTAPSCSRNDIVVVWVGPVAGGHLLRSTLPAAGSSQGGTVASGVHSNRRPPPASLNAIGDAGIDCFEHFWQPSGREAAPHCYPPTAPSGQMQQCPSAGLEPPSPSAGPTLMSEAGRGRVRRRDLLGGALHEYRRAA